MGKVILITGASSGFGKATAERLACKGHIVYGTSRRPQIGENIRYLQMDVRDASSVGNGVEKIVKEEGRVDVVICNAGKGIGGSLEFATQEEIQDQMQTNFMGCVNVCQKVLPYMRKQRAGRIINLSSIGGIMGLPYQGFYSASKFAIEGFSEALSAEVKGFGITVSIVEPGDFKTGFTASRVNSQATRDNADYGESFNRALGIIEKEENGGLDPKVLATTIEKIVDSRHPKFRYPVANIEQRLSIMLHSVLPGNWFVDVLRRYYKV